MWDCTWSRSSCPRRSIRGRLSYICRRMGRRATACAFRLPPGNASHLSSNCCGSSAILSFSKGDGSMLIRLKHFALAAVTFVCAAGFLEAQSNAIDAAIEGYVRDATGGAISGANLTARNTATNVASETRANAEGYFRFPLLQVGVYKLSAGAEGFKAFSQTEIAIAAGQKMRIDIDMQVGSRAESVEVTAGASMEIADTGSSAVGGVVTSKEVEDLPIVSRNIYNYQLLAPGVQGLSSPTFSTTQF